jgi:glycosyltransferase involved in cell wall biosynthesis
LQRETYQVKAVPLLSVVIPVYNGGAQLERCLDALLASDFRRYEILVVDDGSTDASATKAQARRGVEVLRLTRQRGPAAARNHGAAHARGGIIFFVDADVVVQRDTLRRVAAHFRRRPNVAAVFGSYDDEPAAENFVSQYRNLLHHFVHQRSASQAETFWAGCGAIRRRAFEAVGGFDERKYRQPSIEDIELGYRLRRAGFAITLDHKLQVKHLKRWTFVSMLHTDIFNRALPWSRLILEEDGMINDLNLRVPDRVSAALVALASALLALSCFLPALLYVMLATLGAVFLLNFRFYLFLRKRRGLAFRSFAMLALYYFYSGTVFVLCYGAHVLRKAGGIMRLRPTATTGDGV